MATTSLYSAAEAVYIYPRRGVYIYPRRGDFTGEVPSFPLYGRVGGNYNNKGEVEVYRDKNRDKDNDKCSKRLIIIVSTIKTGTNVRIPMLWYEYTNTSTDYGGTHTGNLLQHPGNRTWEHGKGSSGNRWQHPAATWEHGKGSLPKSRGSVASESTSE